MASPSTLTLICFLLLATTLSNAARILQEPDQSPQPDVDVEDAAVAPLAAPITTTQPSDPITTTVPQGPSTSTEPDDPVASPVADATPITNPQPITTGTPSTATTSPGSTSTGTITAGAGAGAGVGAGAGAGHPTLSFFMHDILGGLQPSGRVVTGIVANSDANNLPFSVPNNQVFPINGGVPLNTINGVINNNNFPSLVGLNGSPSNTLVQNSGASNILGGGNSQAFVSAGQLPAGVTLQQLMFGSITVVDNEITEGHELGSSVLGKAQGFYLASSADGSSHTLALTTLFHGHDHHEIEDTISFFGIHRTATPISHIAIIGGTGKYENARGYATIETLPHEDQHTTDGLETITHFTVYLIP